MFILILLGFLVVIGCVATAFYLSPKREAEALAHDRAQRHALAQEMVEEARVAGIVAEEVETTVPAGDIRYVGPLESLVVVRAHADPIVGNLILGTYLARIETDQWTTPAGVEIPDAEVARLLTLGVVARPVSHTTRRTDVDFTSAYRAAQADFQALQNDLRALQADWRRALTTTVRIAPSTNVNRAQTAPAPPPVPAAPRPPRPTPKRAIDRLLEDDDLIDDDSGVKPG